jgi:hypothetical protein
MSKADKTRPAWVQLRDPAMPTRISHNHRLAECSHATCHARWARSYGWTVAKIYGAGLPPALRHQLDRRARTRTRDALRTVVRSVNGVLVPIDKRKGDSADVAPTRHRHSALWDWL